MHNNIAGNMSWTFIKNWHYPNIPNLASSMVQIRRAKYVPLQALKKLSDPNLLKITPIRVCIWSMNNNPLWYSNTIYSITPLGFVQWMGDSLRTYPRAFKKPWVGGENGLSPVDLLFWWARKYTIWLNPSRVGELCGLAH